MTYKFKLAPMDKTVKLLSNPITVIIAIICGLFWWILFFPFSPRSYLVSPDGITIRTLITYHTIPAAKIKSITTINNVKPGVGLTWFAGLFGYAGVFSLADGSTAKVYATNWRQMVRIDTIDNDPYLLSPQNIEDFVRVANEIILIK